MAPLILTQAEFPLIILKVGPRPESFCGQLGDGTRTFFPQSAYPLAERGQVEDRAVRDRPVVEAFLRSPLPASRMTSLPGTPEMLMQAVLPPYRAVPGPGVGIDPRVPQNVT